MCEFILSTPDGFVHATVEGKAEEGLREEIRKGVEGVFLIEDHEDQRDFLKILLAKRKSNV